jgi:hypothetical protein
MAMTAGAVQEHPILFSGAMVRAILDGKKTQTRRVICDRNSQGNIPASCLLLDDPRTFVDDGPSPAGNPGPYLHAYVNAPAWERRNGWEPGDAWPDIMERLYPRIWTGDRLWVRETWGTVTMHELGQHVFCGRRVPDRTEVVYRAGKRMGVPVPGTSPVEFRTEWRDDFQPATWYPSIHMPRWASRLMLEVTQVHAQRLQEISEEDAIAEGVERDRHGWRDYSRPNELPQSSAADSFCTLWDVINGKRRGRSWADNPWVWALTFRCVATS